MAINVDEFISVLSEKLKEEEKTNWEESGRVVSVKDSIITVSGLENVKNMEIVRTENNVLAVAFNLERNLTRCVLLKDENVKEGELVFLTNKIISIPVGDFSGRIINPLGVPIDGGPDLIYKEEYNIEQEPTKITDRSQVNREFLTGLAAIELLTPIGCGQRQMLLGDSKTGKTTIGLQAIINQKKERKTDKKVYCIYNSIGKKSSDIAKIKSLLQNTGAMEYTLIVHASASDSPLMKYIAPYSAMAIGEYLKKQGEDVFIVFDDLYTHAIAYREISLLLRRTPGRNAFPGDTFYIHARLLERASQDKKGGSITALAIVETQGGDFSAYIPTNIISITDGQIFLSTSLFNQGIKPAIDIGRSVSRIGSTAQSAGIKEVSAGLKGFLSNFEELQQFASFLSDLDEETELTIKRGRFLRELAFVQDENKLLKKADCILLVIISQNHRLHLISHNDLKSMTEKILYNFKKEYQDVYFTINNAKFEKGYMELMKQFCEKTINEWQNGEL